MAAMLGLLRLLASQDVVIRTVESPSVTSFAALEVPEGEIGIVLGPAPEMKDLLAAAGFMAAPFERGRVAVISDAKEAAGAKAEVVVLVTSLPRDQAAAILRETPRIALCIVTGRGGGDS